MLGPLFELGKIYLYVLAQVLHDLHTFLIGVPLTGL